MLPIFLSLLCIFTANGFSDVLPEWITKQLKENKGFVRKTLLPIVTTFASKQIPKAKENTVTIEREDVPLYMQIDTISTLLTTAYMHLNEFGMEKLENIHFELAITLLNDRCIKRKKQLFAPITYKDYIIFHDKNMLSTVQSTCSSLLRKTIDNETINAGTVIDTVKDNGLKELCYNVLSQATHGLACLLNIDPCYVECILSKHCATQTDVQRAAKIVFSLLFSHYVTPHIPKLAT